MTIFSAARTKKLLDRESRADSSLRRGSRNDWTSCGAIVAESEMLLLRVFVSGSVDGDEAGRIS